ncbi:MAG: glycoside hydrolase/phage tail family protein [Pseudomonadota bacterium]
MATLLLSAAGAAIGSGFGGTLVGLSGAVIGRAVGATLGRAIDQRLMGVGSEAVEMGRVDRLRLTGAGEGAAIPQVWGRMRLAGQMIWATEFLENVQRTRGGKGAPRPTVTQYSYSVSLAIALCEGEILRVGRVWADGAEVAPGRLNMQVYTGSEDQLPDARIEAVEGAGRAPAYRGTAYVVIEDLDLSPYGNRVPQFTFEVMRRAQGAAAAQATDLADAVKGVALIPGTGEYGLATTPVHYAKGPGVNVSANVHSPSGQTDFATSLAALVDEAPGCAAVSLIVSWFGTDLRCGACDVRPLVEDKTHEGAGMVWRAGGIGRAAAQEVPRDAGRSIYGGTPADASVIEAIAALRQASREVMFYPFILMEQLAGNTLPDPYSDGPGQPALPWRGRITLSKAPGLDGSPDRTTAAEAEVAAFFGMAQPGDFAIANGTITYSGPSEWRYRRFILHYAHLCALAGGVDAFCIGSELRGLTQLRGAGDSFPAVAALRQLAAEVRGILGPATKISYAADWSEYFGYHTGGDVYFHLDPLWSDPNIDFVGIDNYMPLADWRDGEDHADAGWGTPHNLGYLKSNVAGGEGFYWYYDSPEGQAAQRRLPITDGAFGEDWVFRYKDLKSWWSNTHHDRVGGVRLPDATGWVPGSKPFRFTEYGCAALDKAANEPNKFLDPKSSESALPRYSNGRRDDLIQMQYLRAMAQFWSDGDNNPMSGLYAGPMVDMDHAYVWAWDARPFPEFPAQSDVWSDAANYARGHWLNGRITNQPLATVVADLCEASGVVGVDVSGIEGVVRGFTQAEVGSARSALQSLTIAYGLDAVERAGVLQFRMRDGRLDATLEDGLLALSDDLDGTVETSRVSDVEIAGRVRLGFVEAEGSYDVRFAEAIFPDEESRATTQSELPLVLTSAEAKGIAERWLTEARVARDTARFALPLSQLGLGAGDVVQVQGRRYRIDRVEQAEAQVIEAVRVEPAVYLPSEVADDPILPRAFVAPVPVYSVFLDLPLLTGQEVPHAPHVAVTASPWPGAVAVWSAPGDAGYELNRLVAAPAVIGVTESPLVAAQTGVWDKGAALRVRVFSGALASAGVAEVLNGANAMAVGDGSSGNWEVIQFAEAVLVAPSTYDISLRLRGQAGTDGIMPAVWPVGSQIVLLDRTVAQLDLALSARGLARHYRIGAAGRGYDDPNVTLHVEAFDGIGLRPYRVAHLKAMRLPTGEVSASWVRRTRIDGDTWQSVDVPLGEDSERYAVRIIVADAVVFETVVSTPSWVFDSLLQVQTGVTGAFGLAVAQMSDRYGPGPFRAVAVAA